jgi:hypothetical protein
MRNAILLFLLCCGGIAAATVTQPAFFGRRDYPSAPGFAVVADINGDGIPDVITMGPFGLDALLGNGNGSFRVGPTSTIGGQLGFFGIVPIDLNGDGNIDLVIAQPGGIEVCLGNGDGTFQPAVAYGPGGGGFIAVGDFNGDGIPDVAIPNSNGIYLYTGQGGGVFSPGVLTPVSPSGSLANRTLVAADFNGDGKLDLAVATLQPSGFIVMLGNGDGTFQAPTAYTGTSPTWVAAGDLNGDGHPDIVVSSGSAFVYLNNGHGQFSQTTSVPLSGPQLAIGKINGDDIPDLVSSTGSVAFGIGHGKFAPPVSYAVESSGSTADVVLAELTTNGRMDIIAGQNGALSVLLNEGNGTFVDGEWTSVLGSGNCGAAADFNGDGKPDLAVPTTSGITVLFGTGNASAPYSTGPSFAVSGVGCPITGDLNGDGVPDLLVGANGLGGVGAYLGNGDGTFQLAKGHSRRSGHQSSRGRFQS